MYHMYLIIVLRRCAIDEASIKSSSFTSLEAMQIAAEKVEVGTMKHLMNPKIVPIDKTMKHESHTVFYRKFNVLVLHTGTESL